MGNEFIGKGSTAVLRKVRGERGARIRIKAGLQQRSAARPQAAPGEVADRAEAGFTRRHKELTSAKTPEARAAAHERARAALSKYEAATASAEKSMHAAEGRLNKATPLTPAQIDAAGFASAGGKLVPKYEVRRSKETGKLVRVKVGMTRVGRDRSLFKEGGVDLGTYKRLKREASDARDRHTEMSRRLSQMRRALHEANATPPPSP